MGNRSTGWYARCAVVAMGCLFTHGVSGQHTPGAAAPLVEQRIDPGFGSRTPLGARAVSLESRGLVAAHVYAAWGRASSIGRAVRAEAGAKLVRTARAGDLVCCVVEATPAAVRRLAGVRGVVWVEQAPEPTPRNATLRRVVQSGTGDHAPFDEAGLDGSGQIVGVIDDPLDWDHCAFDDAAPIGPSHRKIAAYNAPFGGVSAHGTHVCGTLLGDSDEHPDLRGVATGARLVFDTIPGLEGPLLAEQLETHAAQGARVHSNSWGDEQSDAYGGLAHAVDAFCWADDAHLVVTASANRERLRTPENAKNTLSVSASLDAPFHDRFCVGPGDTTRDGRRKPELVAPGCSIFSAYPFGAGCPTVFNSGTSMAAPGIAGAALIARQYFMEGWHPLGEPSGANAFEPSGALLKAVLIAGAADLSGEPGWPSAREGWGRVDLSRSLPLGLDDPDRLFVVQRWNHDAGGEPSLRTGDTLALHIDVFDPGRSLRVVLSWHDAPGALGSDGALVNDLDLVVVGPSGSLYVGNAIDAVLGESVPVSGWPVETDSINNTEVVGLAFPEPGVYSVTVMGSAVREGAQGFGLAVIGGVRGAAMASCSVSDLAEPIGVLDLSDIAVFVEAFVAQEPVADLRADGVFDLSDITVFVAGFTGGCG